MTGKPDISSKKFIVPPVPPSTPSAGMSASTLFDMIMGIDVHQVNIPPAVGVPIPHPAIGIAFDPTLLLPPISVPVPYCIAAPAMKALEKINAITAPLNQNIFAMGSAPPPPPPPEPEPPPDPDAPPPPTFIDVPTGVGASVLINSMPRTNVSTKYKQIPPHIPLGAGFTVPPNIKNAGHAFMGSLTVNVEGNPFSFSAIPFTSCQCIGKPDSEDGGMSLPTTIVTPIPKGPAVMIGGPPVPVFSIMDAMKFGMKFLKKLMKKSGLMKKISDWLHAKFNAQAGSWKSKLICFFTGHPVDVGSGYFYTSKTDFELPGPIPLKWERDYYSRSKYDGPLGHGWHHCYDLYIDVYEKEGGIGLRFNDGRMIALPTLKVGETYFEPYEKIDWFKDAKGYAFTTKENLTYRFGTIGETKNLQRLATIENRAGFKITFEYNSLARLNKIIDSAGRRLRVLWNDAGKMQSIESEPDLNDYDAQTFVKYYYDEFGDLIQSRDALNQPMSYRYRNHLMVKETNRNGLSFFFEYDGNNSEAKCIRTWGTNNIYYREMQYLEGHTIVRDLQGNITQYFHEDGLVYKIVNAEGGISTTVRNSTYDVIEETDEEGLTTLYAYDNRGNKTGINYPDGAGIAYDFVNDLPVMATDERGGLWMWQYNNIGKVEKQTDPLGNSTKYEYTNGLLKAVIRADNSITTIEYDRYYNVNKLIFPDGNNSEWEYDKLGRCTEFKDVNNGVQYRRYDAIGRVIEITEPDGNKINLSYDGEGNVIKAKDKLREVDFVYAGMNKMIKRKENKTELEFIYDKEEQLVGIKNEKGIPYNFKLDALGNVVEEIGFDKITRKFNRDKAGKTTGVERPGKKFTQYEYDEGGRINKVIQYDDSTEVFVYDQAGNLIEAINENCILKFERDKLGRIIKETQGPYTVESNYDKKGNRIQVQSNLGADIQYERNALGDVTKIAASNGLTEWAANIQYDALGLETRRDMPGGLQSRWKRDKLGRPLQHQVSNGTTLHRSRQYVWDYDDRLKQMIDQTQGRTEFGHDEVGNLTWAKYNDGYTEYRIADETGNYYKTKDKSDRKFGQAGQLLESKEAKYEYDEEGNLIRKVKRNGEVWHYQWQANGMLKKVIRPDKEMVSFTYDALGRRLSKTYKGVSTKWIWNGNILIHEWAEQKEQMHLSVDTSGKILETKFPKHLITWIFHSEFFAPVAKLLNKEKLSIVTDHLGTPAEMYNSEGNKVWEISLNIYGETRNIIGLKTDCPFRYPGQYEDAETELYYNRFRYYDAESGNYISIDPIRLKGGLNFFKYVKSTLKFIDIFGLSSTVPTDITSIGRETPRDKDFPSMNPDTKIIPSQADVKFPEGKSLTNDPDNSFLTGRKLKIPAETELPPGLGVKADGKDVFPDSPHGKGHHTIYPTEDMSKEEFDKRYLLIKKIDCGVKK